MTQAIGMDQVGRLEPMRGARRGERSDGAIVPGSQLKTELLVSSQKDERPLLRGSRCRWGTGFWMLTTVSSKPPPPPQCQVTGCDRLHRKSAMRRKQHRGQHVISPCRSSVSGASGSSLIVHAQPMLVWTRMQRVRDGRLSNGTPDLRPATPSDGSGVAANRVKFRCQPR